MLLVRQLHHLQNLLLPLKIVIWPTIVLVFFSAGDQFSISVNPSYDTSITLNLNDFLILKCQIKTQEAYSLSCNLKFQTSKCSSVRLSLLLVQVVQWDLFLPLSSPVSIVLQCC